MCFSFPALYTTAKGGRKRKSYRCLRYNTMNENKLLLPLSRIASPLCGWIWNRHN